MTKYNIKPGTLITSDMLESMNACPKDLRIFRKTWPNGMSFRKKNLLKAGSLNLGVYWFGRQILSETEHIRLRDEFVHCNDGETEEEDAAYALWNIISTVNDFGGNNVRRP